MGQQPQWDRLGCWTSKLTIHLSIYVSSSHPFLASDWPKSCLLCIVVVHCLLAILPESLGRGEQDLNKISIFCVRPGSDVEASVEQRPPEYPHLSPQK